MVNAWWQSESSHVVFGLEDLQIDFSSEFETLESGFLQPVIWACNLSWGRSQVYHSNPLAALMFDQTIHYLMVVI